jgi:hypothetical protein
VTGAIVDELPLGALGTTIAPDLSSGKFQTFAVSKVETLHLGFAIQYSTLYLTSRFTGGEPAEEPLNQLLPRSNSISILRAVKRRPRR